MDGYDVRLLYHRSIDTRGETEIIRKDDKITAVHIRCSDKTLYLPIQVIRYIKHNGEMIYRRKKR